MKKLGFLILGMFTFGSSTFMIAGLLPNIGETLNSSIEVTGQGITVFGISYLLSAPLFSLFLSKPKSKNTLLWALLVFIFGNLLTAYSTSLDIFLISRVIAGLSAGVFNPTVVGLAIQIGGEVNKGKILSLVWGANSAGVVLGVPIGVLIAKVFSWQYSIGISILLSIATLCGLYYQRIPHSLSTQLNFSQKLRLIRNKRILSILVITGLTCFITTGLYSYISQFNSFSFHSLPSVLFAWGLGGVLGSSTIGFLVDRLKSPRGVMAGLLGLIALNFMVLPLIAPHPVVGLLPFFLWGFLGWATVTPQQYTLFQIQSGGIPLLSALNSSAIGLGGSLGTAIGGLLLSNGYDHLDLIYLSAIFLIIVLVLQVLSIVIPFNRGLVHE